MTPTITRRHRPGPTGGGGCRARMKAVSSHQRRHTRRGDVAAPGPAPHPAPQPNALKRAHDVARFVVNLPATVPGLLYAGASGADCGWASGLMIACTGATRFAPKGGQTVGNVFTTRDLSVSSTVLEHETQHANQYAALGFLFPGMGLPAFGVSYAGASGFSWVTYHIVGERHDGAGNVCDERVGVLQHL